MTHPPDRNARVTDRNEAVARTCTCHPDDNPPVPCAQRYALSACLTADLATMTADHDRWRAQAEHTYPGKGRR
jgi:hypothetical protein